MSVDRTPNLASLRPIGLPRDVRGLLQFPSDVAARIEALLEEARTTGRWSVPEDVPIELRSERFWAYWIAKTVHPIERAMPGSGVEEALAPFRRTRLDLLPPGFEVHRERTLSACGDLMCTRGLETARDCLYAEVADLVFSADIAYANLESTLTQGVVKPMAFSMEEAPSINVTLAQYQALVKHRGRSFDVLHLANNHILDCGEEGVRTTLAQLEADGIQQVGVNPTAEVAREPRIIESAGLRIGWVAHTFSVNFKPFPEGKPWIVNMTPFHLEDEPDTSAIEAQIAACRQVGCDLVVVALHWGLEFEFQPHPQQRLWAHRFAYAGADLVIGHHPHVVQGVEIVQVPGEPIRNVPILYSLGNLTPVLSHPAKVLSIVTRLRLSHGLWKGRERTVVANLELVPIVLLSDAEGRPVLKRLSKLAEVAASSALSLEMQAYMEELCHFADLVLGRDWRNGS